MSLFLREKSLLYDHSYFKVSLNEKITLKKVHPHSCSVCPFLRNRDFMIEYVHVDVCTLHILSVFVFMTLNSSLHKAQVTIIDISLW